MVCPVLVGWLQLTSTKHFEGLSVADAIRDMKSQSDSFEANFFVDRAGALTPDENIEI